LLGLPQYRVQGRLGVFEMVPHVGADAEIDREGRNGREIEAAAVADGDEADVGRRAGESLRGLTSLSEVTKLRSTGAELDSTDDKKEARLAA